MSNIIYDENFNTPLNKKIAALWSFSVEMCQGHEEEFKKLCREIYEMGFEDGQQFVWKMRAGQFEKTEITDYGKKIATSLGLSEEEFLEQKPYNDSEHYMTLSTINGGKINKFKVTKDGLENDNDEN